MDKDFDEKDYELVSPKDFNRQTILDAHQYENVFEPTVKTMVNKFNADLRKINRQYAEFRDKLDAIPDYDPDKIEKIYEDLEALSPQAEYCYDQWLALNEMRIIYMFKSVEIGLKSLIKTAYPKSKLKGLHNWDFMDSFFKEKGINLKALEGYKEVDELRRLNNNLKHSEEWDMNSWGISEFKGEQLGFDEFVNRIEPKVIAFHNAVAEQVVKELYHFDDVKLETLADDIFNRMSREEVLQFIENLKNKYEMI